ncbi:hypothetical protein SPFL3102_03835 [Sporomusaceae bacterium FL31]|nr:hypothetical protein SPFL3101_01908 [Sporomusaceae bacterium FL31]GCE35976.1 hypothetical protein SPFL3102_03835 [Sporomusaceae bacterium]
MYVEVYLEFPENMIGIVVLESVISYKDNGEIIKNYQELIDNTPFNNSGENNIRLEIKQYISSITGVSQDLIRIMN